MTDPNPDNTDSSITDQLFEIEQRLEKFWMVEANRMVDDREEKLLKQYHRYIAFFESMVPFFESKGMSHLMNGAKIPDEALNELSELLKMGQHFKFLIAEMKRNPQLQSHWEQLCVLLRLAEDDDTQKYYGF